MTREEFSNEFDVLYNNITSNQAPGLDEYEKSVFLTKAQDEILKSYFNPRLNKSQEGFDGNEKRQIDFSMIMKTVSYANTAFTQATFDNKTNTKSISIESDIMMFINEFADVTRDGKSVRLVVIPLDYKEYARLSNKPYKRPTHYQAWRLIDNANTSNRVEIIIGANDILTNYSIRYIKKPYPIILEDLDSITINGKYVPYPTYVNNSLTIYKVNEPLTTGTYTFSQVDDGKEDKIVDDVILVYPRDKQVARVTHNFSSGVYYELIGDDKLITKVLDAAKGKTDYSLFRLILKYTDQACELDPILHQEILQRAVELAKAAYQGGLDTQIALGQNSETNMGVIPQAR